MDLITHLKKTNEKVDKIPPNHFTTLAQRLIRSEIDANIRSEEVGWNDKALVATNVLALSLELCLGILALRILGNQKESGISGNIFNTSPIPICYQAR